MFEQSEATQATSTKLRHGDYVMWSLAGVLAVGFVAAFAAVALARLTYPYELEWLEYGVLGHVERVLDGKSLYGEPTKDFVPFLYPPLYYYAAAALSGVVGGGLLPLRLLSLCSTVVTLWLIHKVVTCETNRRLAGLLSAGIYAACYPLTGWWYDLARVDSLFIALLIGGVAILRFGQGPRAFAMAGVLIAAAALTKQTALIVAVPLGLYLLATGRRPAAMWFLATLAAVVGSVTLALQAATHGWYRFWVFELGGQHAKEPTAYERFFREDLAPLGIVIALCIAGATVLFRSPLRWSAGFWLVGTGAAAVASLSSRVHTGGFLNVLMPVYLFIAILFGIAVAALLRRRTPWTRVVAVAVVVQLLALSYDPRPAIPTADDERAGDRFVEWIAGFDGEVLVMSHPHYAVLAGKPDHAGQAAIIDVLRARDEDAKNTLRRSYVDGVRSRRYAAIVIDGPGDLMALPDDLAVHYEASPVDVFQHADDLLPVSSLRTRPAIVYTPRQD